MNYEPEVYDHSLVLPLSEDRGFAIVLKGERYYQPIDDWYFVGNDGNVLSFLTFGGKEQKEKQTSFLLNDYLTDGVFYLGCVQHSNLLRFDPETLELRMVYEEKKAKYPLESKKCSYFFASEKKNRVLLGFQHSQLEYHSWVCRLPQTSSDDWSTLVECDLTKAQTVAHYPAFLNCARLNVVQMFDYDSMSTYDIPAKYRRHEEYKDAELYCFDSVTIAIQHRFIDIYDSRNDRLVFRMSERSLK